jgi:Protein of unknown function (DUF2934)
MTRFTRDSEETTTELTAAQNAPTQEEIAVRAYEIYLERGAEQGSDVDDWLQAERELTELRETTQRRAKAHSA